MPLNAHFNLAAVEWDTALLPLAIPLAAVAVLCAAAAYRARRAVQVSWWMPILRIAAWLAVAVSLVKPVAVLVSGRQSPPAVLVLVDLSKSMSVCDRQRSAAQCVALADVLGRLPAGVRQRIADAFFAAIADARRGLDEMALAQREVEFSRFSVRDSQAAEKHLEAATDAVVAAAQKLAGMGKNFAIGGQPIEDALREIEQWTNRRRNGNWPAQLRRMLDRCAAAARDYQNAEDSRLYYSNPQVRTACNEIRSFNRLQLVQAAMNAPGGMIAAAGKSPIIVYGIGDDAAAIPLQDFRGLKGETGNLEAGDDHSRLVEGVRQAVERSSAHQHLQAVVLFSDGRDTDGQSPGATELPGTALPLLAVDVTPPVAARDPAVTHVIAPAWAWAGDTVPVSVGVRGKIGQVRLTLGDLPPQTLPPPAGEGETALTFQVKCERGGLQRLRAEIAPVGEDATAENNHADAWIKVMDEKVRVAAIGPAGDAAPKDWNLLLADLRQTPWIELTESPRTPADILRQDVLVIGDVPAAQLGDARRQAIEQFISRQGGGVLMLAGRQHPSAEDAAKWGAWFPVEYASSTALPVWQTWPGSIPQYAIVPAGDAMDALSVRLADTPEKSLRQWEALAPVFSYWPLTRMKSGARALLVDASSKQPLLIERDFGAGKAMLLGLDECWRWAAAGNSATLLRFHQQMIRALAGRPYAVTQAMEDGPAPGRISFDVEPASPLPSQPLHLRARFRPTAGEEPPLEVQVMKKDEQGGLQTISKFDLAAPSSGERYEATISPLEAGDYELRVAPEGENSSAAPLRYPLTVAAEDRAEWADVGGDHDFLQRMTEPTGGQVFALDDLPEFSASLRQALEPHAAVVRLPIWDSAFLFAFVAACLVAEWALRKRAGLA